ncbi:hypothetical protein BDQ12DRAFT_731010 [Crucibulum laeve]|uniref:Uncharacterized protein n=1 Tax=Crucibulum laeve TaxID=68775 RepID=A0A5C3MI57_9AGAR|nr:hypothetical protein BDQ12DRAFT_731010 [Crucibulum laeve]
MPTINMWIVVLTIFISCQYIPSIHAQTPSISLPTPNPTASSSSPPKPTSSRSPSLNFHVSSGGNENYFWRDNITSAQLLLTSTNNTLSTARRLVAALPAGNNGALVYFLPLGGANGTGPGTSGTSGVQSSDSASANQLNVELVNDTLTSTTDKFNNAGVQADLTFSANATLGVTIVGAVRALRDYVEGSGTMHEIFNYTPGAQYSKSHPKAESPLFKSVDLYLSIPPGSSASLSVVLSTNGSFTPPTIDILVPPTSIHSTSDSPIDSEAQPRQPTVRIRVLTNDTTLLPLDTQSLFLTSQQGSTQAVKTALAGLANGTSPLGEQVSFLTYQDKFTAGGWRFLTYFGRDSLIALRLLMPLMTPDAIESALGAVIERANSTGALCHEETVGDYASFININSNASQLGNTPFYDYKMIDTDLLLLPAVAHYFLELPQGKNRSAGFLERSATLQKGTYAGILERIASYNLARALPFSSSSTFQNLLSFRPDQPVGNWRDSNQGTGYGRTPFDVNSALVPANIRAVDSLMQAGILPRNLTVVEGDIGVDLDEIARIWEGEAPKLFEVSVEAAEAEGRARDFIGEVGLSDALLGNSTSGNGTTGNVSFYALSLMDDGSPVEVLNSDLGFNLLYGFNVSAVFLERVVDALVPYPRGLLTNVGMLVANPAYDSNRTNVHVLDRTAYHGTVVRSFQQGLMAGGLARQLGLCSSNSTTTSVDTIPPTTRPSWCDTDLQQRLNDAQTRLWESIRGASDNLYSEVWSYSFSNVTNQFSIADLASLSPEGTESDAIQLWSYGFLGLVDPEGQRAGSE